MLRLVPPLNAEPGAAVNYSAPIPRAMEERVQIAPQDGPQWAFAACDADIVVYGGAAGSGKSTSLLLEPFRFEQHPRYRAVIFRRTTPQLTNPGGLFDQARELYQGRASSRQNFLDFTFPSGGRFKLAHLEHEKNVEDYQGAAADYFGFDELTQFTERMFWYIALSRARSTSGIRPYIRTTCNPDPDSWVRNLIDWYIDEEGYAIDERSGVVRWFYRVDDEMLWYDSEEEARADNPDFEHRPKSFTFIKARLEDNPALDLVDPDYRAGLEALPLVEKEQLLHGNWNIRRTAGLIFDRANFRPITRAQLNAEESGKGVDYMRGWDKAGTEGGKGARTAGTKIGRYRSTRRFVVAHCVARRVAKPARESMIVDIARLDGRDCRIAIEAEGGSDGGDSAAGTIRGLAGYIARAYHPTGNKADRADPLSVQVLAGNVDIVIDDGDPWAEDFLQEAQNFDGVTGLMDRIDAAGLAFNKLVAGGEAGGITY